MKDIKKIIGIVLVMGLLIAGFIFNKNSGSKEYEITRISYFEYFDTAIDISFYEEVENKEELESLVENRIKEVHEMTSSFDDYNNNGLYELNETGEVDNEELARLIEYAISYYEDYSVQFNIALGPIIDIWKESLTNCRELNKCEIPSEKDLEEAGEIDAASIVVDGSVIKINDTMKLDLGAISKGYLTDELTGLLKEQGYKYFLINAGGNVYGTTKPAGESYSVAVVDPIENSQSFITLSIENKSVVTSGDYERYFEVDNKRYNHLINTETLFPSTYHHSVTIVSDKSIDGDILSTMLFGLSYEEGIEIVEDLDGVDAIWYTTEKEIYKSSGIDNYEKK